MADDKPLINFKCWLRGHLWTWTGVSNVGRTYFAVHTCKRCPAEKEILIQADYVNEPNH